MLAHKFDELWEKSIAKRAKWLIEMGGKNYIVFYKERKIRIENHYKRWKNKTKAMMHQHTSEDGDKLLDRHKIASILLYAILLTRPFSLMRKNKAPMTARYANELLGFLCGLDIIRTFNVADVKEGKIQNCDTFHLPLAEKESYLKQTLRCLWHAHDQNKFDIFSFANLFFMIEQYSNMIGEPIIGRDHLRNQFH